LRKEVVQWNMSVFANEVVSPNDSWRAVTRQPPSRKDHHRSKLRVTRLGRPQGAGPCFFDTLSTRSSDRRKTEKGFHPEHRLVYHAKDRMSMGSSEREDGERECGIRVLALLGLSVADFLSSQFPRASSGHCRKGKGWTVCADARGRLCRESRSRAGIVRKRPDWTLIASSFLTVCGRQSISVSRFVEPIAARKG